MVCSEVEMYQPIGGNCCLSFQL